MYVTPTLALCTPPPALSFIYQLFDERHKIVIITSGLSSPLMTQGIACAAHPPLNYLLHLSDTLRRWSCDRNIVLLCSKLRGGWRSVA